MAGTITYSHHQSDGAFASGKIVADGAATNVIVGFHPSRIVIFNDTDDAKFEWFLGIAAGSFYQQITDGTLSLVTSGGPTIYGDDSDETSGHGWTLPATAVLNTASDVLYWQAWR